MSQNNEEIVLHVENMTCTGCETRIENALHKLEGIIEVKAIYSSSNVYVTYDNSKIGIDEIVASIEKIDYKVINKSSNIEDTTEKSDDDLVVEHKQNKAKVGQMIGIGVIILALYLIINNTIGFNFIPEINQSMGYGLLFMVGLLTSLHCVAMCGGINLSVCMQYKTEEDGSKFAKLKPSLLYNLGRVISYTTLGGIVGALGSVVSLSGTAKGIVSVLSGVFMVIMGINMLNIFPALRKFNPRLPKFLGKKVHSNANKKGPLIVGLLNGLMPCGPLQAMQLYALGTGSFVAGALSMFIFSIGTVPLMFGFGAISSLISGKFTHKMMKVSAVLVIVLGFFMLNRGLNLSGLGFVSSSASTGDSSIAKIENGVQLVSTELEPGGYTPIIVQKGIPVKWTIKVEKGDLNGCNNPITIPQYNRQVKLKIGDNLIEFTPEKEGDIIYTCWMGMISSRIRVVSDINNVSAEDIKDTNGSGTFWKKEIEAPEIPTDEIAIGEIRDGIQYVSIDVNEDEFSPAVVVLQENVKTVWTINGVELNDHNKEMLFPEYQARLEVKDGENILNVTPEFDFTFSCSLGTMNGYVKVVEDIANINIDDIKKEVQNYQPSNGAGGASCH